MENYDLYLPTHLIFGRGRIDKLPSLLPAKGSRILLAMGGGSIRRIVSTTNCVNCSLITKSSTFPVSNPIRKFLRFGVLLNSAKRKKSTSSLLPAEAA